VPGAKRGTNEKEVVLGGKEKKCDTLHCKSSLSPDSGWYGVWSSGEVNAYRKKKGGSNSAAQEAAVGVGGSMFREKEKFHPEGRGKFKRGGCDHSITRDTSGLDRSPEGGGKVRL